MMKANESEKAGSPWVLIVGLSLFLIISAVVFFKTKDVEQFGAFLGFCTFILLALTAWFAWKNIEFLRSQNEIQKQNLEMLTVEKAIINESEVLEQILRGILNPSGNPEGEKQNVYGRRMYQRLDNNGFYDGARAFLGDMVGFPNMGVQMVGADDFEDAVFYYFYGAARFGLSWRVLFDRFVKVCDMKQIPNGLDGKHSFSHVMHDFIFDLQYKRFYVDGSHEYFDTLIPKRETWIEFLKCRNEIIVSVLNHPDLPIDCSSTELQLTLNGIDIESKVKNHVKTDTIRRMRI